MDLEKLIKWLDNTCVDLDGLASSSDDNDSIFYTGQLVFASKLLDILKNGTFDN